jgi:aminocarboxymuconate-semialdehyde decarboxylase
MIVDCHAHVVLETTMGAAGPHGPELTDAGFRVGDYVLQGVRYRGTAFMDIAQRIAGMAAAGIDHQVLSPNPLCWFHHFSVEDATAYCRVHNEALVELVDGRPEVSGLAQLPAQDPVAAAAELRRAVADGLVGGAIGSDIGRPFDDAALDPLWLAAAELAVPISIHPGTPGTSAIPSTRDDDRLGRLGLELHTGFAVEETVVVSELVFGRVLQRHSDLDLLLSHGGGATALLAGRWRHAMATRPGHSGDARDVDATLARLWFDNHTGSSIAISALVAEVGADRIVLGTNFSGWDDEGPKGHGLDLDRLGANAGRLFRRASLPAPF